MRNEKKIKSKCDLGGALWQKVTGILIMTVVGPLDNISKKVDPRPSFLMHTQRSRIQKLGLF